MIYKFGNHLHTGGPKAMFRIMSPCKGGRVVKNDIGPGNDPWERSGSGLIIDSDSLDKLHRILDIFS